MSNRPAGESDRGAGGRLPATIEEALRQAVATLERADLESPDIEVRWMLAHVLQLSQTELAVQRTRCLTPIEARCFADLVAERAARRPLQHLLGDVEFYGRRFIVRPGVLIPRPETESVAEMALRLLPARQPAAVADVGCGAGVLAVTIACERPQATTWCTDLARPAVDLTRRNAAAHDVAGRVQVVRGDLLTSLATAARFDLVVSNPPYIPSADIAGLAPEVRDHDPRLALDGGADGLDLVRRLLAEAHPHLRPSGRILIELGYDQGERAARLATARGWLEVEVLPDLAGRDRMLVARAC
jgi:release factor glutamine methyltransferase